MAEKAAQMVNEMLAFVYSIALSISSGTIVTFGSDAVWKNGYTDVWNIVTKVANNIMEPIGIMVIVIMFLLSLVDKVSTEQFTMESLMKDLIKLCLGLYLVTNAVEIVVGCIELGNGILRSVAGVIGGVPENWSMVVTKETFEGFGNFLVTALLSIVFLLFIIIDLIILVIMKGISMIRVLEIALRTALAPVALSDTFAGNILNSHAIGFIRSFAALCLQGVFITVIAHFVPVFWQGVLAESQNAMDVLGGCLNMLLISAVALILMFKSGGIAKEMLGAR
ncbi:MAG: hypothetical protein UIM53_03070 [Acutalibacteraceae bacterium]|nr:hypothetical protein [Acutalibacteraceae bacterium]